MLILFTPLLIYFFVAFQYICNYNVNKTERDDKLLGLLLLVIAVIRILLQKHADQSLNVQKYKLINAVYKLLPYCKYILFYVGE